MDQTYMKEKPVVPLLLSMGIPVIISMIAGALYNIVDSIFVAMISEDAMTAVSLVYPIQNLAHAAGVGFGVGINAMVARRLGEGKTRMANQTASQGVFLSALHGMILTILGMAVIPYFLRMFTSDEVTISYGLTYFYNVFLFSTIDTMGMAYEKVYQSVGKMKISMAAVLIGCGVNIVLDPIFIFGLGPMPELGICGAAWATGIGQTASLLFYLILNHVKPLNVEISLREMRPSKEICGGMYSVGIAATLNMALTSLLLTALNAILAPFSQVYILVLGVYYKLQALLYQGASGVVQGMRPDRLQLRCRRAGEGEKDLPRGLHDCWHYHGSGNPAWRAGAGFPDGAVYADAFDGGDRQNGAPAHQPGLCHVNGFRHCFRRV